MSHNHLMPNDSQPEDGGEYDAFSIQCWTLLMGESREEVVLQLGGGNISIDIPLTLADVEKLAAGLSRMLAVARGGDEPCDDQTRH
jgi:hypothetical protein